MHKLTRVYSGPVAFYPIHVMPLYTSSKHHPHAYVRKKVPRDEMKGHPARRIGIVYYLSENFYFHHIFQSILYILEIQISYLHKPTTRPEVFTKVLIEHQVPPM